MINGIYIFDIVALALIIYGLISGIFRGFAREVISIIALVLAFILTFQFGDAFSVWLSAKPILEPYELYVGVASFVILFLLVWLLVNIIGAIILAFVLKQPKVKILSRLGGAIVGIVKGVLVVVLLYFLLISFVPFINDWVEKSQSAKYVDGPAKKVQVFAGDVLKNDFFDNLLHPKPEPVKEVPAVESIPVPPVQAPGESEEEQPMLLPEQEDLNLFMIESFE